MTTHHKLPDLPHHDIVKRHTRIRKRISVYKHITHGFFWAMMILLAILIIATLQLYNRKNSKGIQAKPNAEGTFCGGIAANLPEYQCPPGYLCKLDGSYPDAGGRCIKQ